MNAIYAIAYTEAWKSDLTILVRRFDQLSYITSHSFLTGSLEPVSNVSGFIVQLVGAMLRYRVSLTS